MYFKSIQLLRAIAALLITFFHLLFWLNTFNPALYPFFKNMFGAIDLFFVISGFVVFQSALRYKAGWQGFLVFLQKRFIRIYPVYWILVLLMITAHLIPYDWAGWWPFIKSCFFIPGFRPIIGVTWTLQYEVYFYLLSGLALLHKNFRYLLVLLVPLFLISVFTWKIGTFSIRQTGLYNEFVMEFLLGMAAQVLYKKIPSSMSWILVILGTGLFLFSLLVYANHLLSFGFPSAILIAGLSKLEWEHKIKIHPLFIRIGNASYIMYLIHGPVISNSFAFWGSVNLPIIIGITIAIVFLSLLFHRYLEKPLVGYLNSHPLFRQES